MQRRNFVNKTSLVLGASLVGANYLFSQKSNTQFHNDELQAIESFSIDFEKTIVDHPNSKKLTQDLLSPQQFVSRKSSQKGFATTYQNRHNCLVVLEKSGKEIKFKFL